MNWIASCGTHSTHFWMTWFPFWSRTQCMTCPSSCETIFTFWSKSTTSIACNNKWTVLLSPKCWFHRTWPNFVQNNNTRKNKCQKEKCKFEVNSDLYSRQRYIRFIQIVSSLPPQRYNQRYLAANMITAASMIARFSNWSINQHDLFFFDRVMHCSLRSYLLRKLGLRRR